MENRGHRDLFLRLLTQRKKYRKRGLQMQVSYVKLWIRLVEKKMSKPELREKARLSASTMTKMNKGEPVSTTILLRICDVLECNIGDIMDVEKSEEG